MIFLCPGEPPLLLFLINSLHFSIEYVNSKLYYNIIMWKYFLDKASNLIIIIRIIYHQLIVGTVQKLRHFTPVVVMVTYNVTVAAMVTYYVTVVNMVTFNVSKILRTVKPSPIRQVSSSFRRIIKYNLH